MATRCHGCGYPVGSPSHKAECGGKLLRSPLRREPPEGAAHLTTEELADRWRTTTGNVHVMRSRGNAPKAIKRGNRLLWPIPVVEAWETRQLA